MKTYWLIITGLVVLALVAVIVANVFISAQTPIAESRDTERIQKQDKRDSPTQTKIQQPEVKQIVELAKPTWLKIAEKKELNPQALFHSKSGKFPDRGHNKPPEYNWQIFKKNKKSFKTIGTKPSEPAELKVSEYQLGGAHRRTASRNSRYKSDSQTHRMKNLLLNKLRQRQKQHWP